MGTQSSRLFFNGKDHRDIYFDGHYHDAMYLGSQLVWEKKPIPIRNVDWETMYIPCVSGGTVNCRFFVFDGLPTVTVARSHYSYVADSEESYIISVMSDGAIKKNDVAPLVSGIILGEYLKLGDCNNLSFECPGSMFLREDDTSILYHCGLNADLGVVKITAVANEGYKNAMLIAVNYHKGWYICSEKAISDYKTYVYDTASGSKIEELTNDIFNGYATNIIAEKREESTYSDKNGTLIGRKGYNTVFSTDGMAWKEVLPFTSNLNRCATYFLGDYYVGEYGKSNIYRVSSGDKRVLYRGNIEAVFSHGEYLYISYSDGVLIRTKNCSDYEGINIGKTVFGKNGNTFIIPKILVENSRYYLCYAAIDF